MKSSKKKILLMASMSWSVNCLAGAVSGGGGNAVTCYGLDGELKTATLLDTYEGSALFGDKFPSSEDAMEDVIDISLERLQSTGFRLLTPNVKSLKESVDVVLKNKRFLPKSDRLKKIDDSFEGFLPENCKVEQAAVFIDQANIVLDNRIWDVLSNRDRAGLILHEAIYWYNRLSNGELDSQRSRRIVSLVLSDSWSFENVLDGLPASYVLCRSLNYENGSYVKPTVFAAYKKNDVKVLQFLALGGDYILSRKTAEVEVDFPFLEELSNKTHYGSQSFTSSSFENNDSISLSRTPLFSAEGKAIGQNIWMSGLKPTYPQRSMEKVQLGCYRIN